MSERFSDELWQGSVDVYRAILAHPFLTGLSDGSLPHDVFAFYVVQDVLWLRRYAQALAVLSARAPSMAETEMFARQAADVVVIERSLHDSILADLAIDPASVETTEMAPTNIAFTSYLLATAYGGTYAEGVGAVLPCYWIYWEVGRALLSRGSPDPHYQRWIDTYGASDFGDVVREVLAVTDRLCPDLTPAERARVHQHFRATSRYEWMFWDMGYRKERWPL